MISNLFLLNFKGYGIIKIRKNFNIINSKGLEMKVKELILIVSISGRNALDLRAQIISKFNEH